jgi:ABC-type lipopolysaccharide export system ATPase subunit
MIASSPFLLSVRKAMLDDFEGELLLACKVAVLSAAGHRRSEIARLLDAPPAALRVAEARVKRACERLDQGND